MNHTILKLGAALCVVVAFAGCSLLKVSVGTGDALPREEVRTRVMTRGFYYDLAAGIAQAADSIVATASDMPTQVRAIRWKIRASRAAVEAAMQSIPDVALADTWILCRRMNEAFAAMPDSLLFGAQSDIARKAAAGFAHRVAELSREMLSSDRYALLERFVAEYVAAHPSFEDGVQASNTTLAWLEFLSANGVEHVYAGGSISEVLADMGDRLGTQTRQFANTIDWSKDIFDLQIEQDSIRRNLTRQLDSLERNFTRMVTVMEHLPQISDHVIVTFNEQVQQMIRAMDAAVDSAFGNLDRQREELQQFLDAEREAMMREASGTIDAAVRTILDALPSILGKVVLWIILLTVVVLGMPFAAGFWLGRLRERVHGKGARTRESKGGDNGGGNGEGARTRGDTE